MATYTGTAGNDSFNGGLLLVADTVNGLAGDDTLNGGAGNDVIDGGDGNDTLIGGIGIDTVSYASALSAVTVSLALTTAQNTVGAGTDTLSGFEKLTGSSYNDTLTGSANSDTLNGGLGNDTLNGGDGNDTLLGSAGADSLSGGNGDDTLDGGAGNDSLNGGAGSDTASYSTATVAVNVNLNLAGVQNTGVGYDTLTAIENLTGSAYNDTLTGNASANILDGGSGDDLLVANGTPPSGGGPQTQDILYGGAGNDILDGSVQGSCRMEGGAGDDVYRVWSPADPAYFLTPLTMMNYLVEQPNEGNDTVVLYTDNGTSLGWTLDANFENMTTTGARGVSVTGNDGNNVLTSGDAGDTLNGGNGTDMLNGGAGNDTLVASAGADTLAGGTGDDTYDLRGATDNLIIELAGEGTDTILTGANFTLVENFENLTGWGSIGLALTGNAGDNTITGSGGGDLISGGGGADTLMGGAGDDVYLIDSADDVVVEVFNNGYDTVATSVSYNFSSPLTRYIEEIRIDSNVGLTIRGAQGVQLIQGGVGNDDLTGSSTNVQIYGDAGDDILRSGGGMGNQLYGGMGNDTYYYNGAWLEQVVENVGEGTDTVISSSNYTLGDNVENLVFNASMSTPGATLTGNALANSITGDAGDDTLAGNGGKDILNGGAGNDWLVGGAGNDTYYVDASGDTITENAGEGTDIVYSTSASFVLSANVENLMINTSAAANATGNGSANTIYAGAGDNVLDGGAGTDTLSYYYSHASGVTVSLALATAQATGGSGSDTLSGFENLVGTNYADILTGDAGANKLTGNKGNDQLDGGLGADVMEGGAGNDLYIVDNAGDVVTESASSGTDTVKSGISHVLAGNVEKLTLTGSSAINGTGNTLNNTITGNGAANVLTGDAGNDSLSGGNGNDTLDGGTGNDTLNGGGGSDTYLFGRNGGADKIAETSGTDTLSLAADVNFDQLWFRHLAATNDLEISIIGGSDKVTVANWYLGSANQVENIQAGGMLLSSANVENLVQAMAAFAPPASGQTTFTALPANYQSALSPVVAANWA